MKLTKTDREFIAICDDWKAPYEVIYARRMNPTPRSYQETYGRLIKLAKAGLLEYGQPNATFRATDAGRAALREGNHAS